MIMSTRSINKMHSEFLVIVIEFLVILVFYN